MSGPGKTGPSALAARLGAALKAAGLTLAGSESCTGGLAAKLLTDAPGSSEFFLGGVVAYSNAAKARLLRVRAGTLARHGAVSPETAREMAENARRIFRSDYAFSVTGIAGPGGGSRSKPVGLVHFGFAHPGGTRLRRRVFPGSRARVRSAAAAFVFGELLKILE